MLTDSLLHTQYTVQQWLCLAVHLDPLRGLGASRGEVEGRRDTQSYRRHGNIVVKATAVSDIVLQTAVYILPVPENGCLGYMYSFN